MGMANGLSFPCHQTSRIRSSVLIYLCLFDSVEDFFARIVEAAETIVRQPDIHNASVVLLDFQTHSDPI